MGIIGFKRIGAVPGLKLTYENIQCYGNTQPAGTGLCVRQLLKEYFEKEINTALQDCAGCNTCINCYETKV